MKDRTNDVEHLANREMARVQVRDFFVKHAARLRARAREPEDVNVDFALEGVCAYAHEILHTGDVVTSAAAEFMKEMKPDYPRFAEVTFVLERACVHTLSEVIAFYIIERRGRINTATWQFMDLVVHELVAQAREQSIADELADAAGTEGGHVN